MRAGSHPARRRCRGNKFVAGPHCVRRGLTSAYDGSVMHKGDVAAKRDLFIEEMKGERRMLPAEIGKHRRDRIALAGQPALTAHQIAQKRRELHPDAGGCLHAV